MPYSYKKTDGSTLVEVANSAINTSACPLTLIGPSYVNWGQALGDNAIKLTENFCHTSSPSNPLKGMLWYDSATNNLKVYDGATWKGVGSRPGQPFHLYADENSEVMAERPYTRSTARFTADGGWQHVMLESFCTDNAYGDPGTQHGPSSILAFYAARGSEASRLALQTGDHIGHLNGFGWDGTTGWRSVGLAYAAGENWTSSAHGTMVTLFGMPNGTSDEQTIIQYWPTDDSFYINKPSLPLVDNAYTLGSAANRWSNVYAANGTIQTSDLRLKTDIQPSALGLDFIRTLRPVSYRWVAGSNQVLSHQKEFPYNPEQVETKPGSRVHWGLIAQEVKAAVDAAGVDFGGWVLSDKDDPDSAQSLRYDQFIAPLIKAMQEMVGKIDAQDAEIAAMSARIAALEARPS